MPSLPSVAAVVVLLVSGAVAQPPSFSVDAEAIDDAVAAVLESDAIPGAVVGVIENGRLVHRKAYGMRSLKPARPMTTDTVFQIGSVTKSMTATVLADLCEDRLVRWDDPIGRQLRKGAGVPRALASLTFRQIATHSSGLPRSAVNRRNVPDTPSVAMPYSVEDLYVGLAKTSLGSKPGERWSYSNVGYGLLGHLVERIAKKPYEQVIKERLFEPLGMKSSGVHPPDAVEKRMADHHWTRDRPRQARTRWVFGEVAGHGGVYTTVDDLARYVSFHAGWTKGPLAEETLADLHRPRIKVGGGSGDSMATGWFLYDLGSVRMVAHGGEVDGHSTLVGFLPRAGVGVIVLANLGGNAADRLSRRLMRTLSGR